MACMTAKETNQLFSAVGGMCPSTSSLDRVPKHLGEHWERNREAFEDELRCTELVPAEAASVSVGIDGVMAPMKDTGRLETRSKKDKLPRGPAGHREVGCGAITLYDEQGNRLQTVRFGRMPEAYKLTLKEQLEAVEAEMCEWVACEELQRGDCPDCGWPLILVMYDNHRILECSRWNKGMRTEFPVCRLL